MLAVFTPTSRYKARRVTRLLGLERSRHRIITAQLNHLVQQGRLLQLPSSSSRYTQPLYQLPPLVPTLRRPILHLTSPPPMMYPCCDAFAARALLPPSSAFPAVISDAALTAGRRSSRESAPCSTSITG